MTFLFNSDARRGAIFRDVLARELPDLPFEIDPAKVDPDVPQGAALVQTGRGAQLDQAALLAALDSGHLSGAVLDVTDPEPLPADHPLWRHPRVLVRPHAASVTQPETAALAVAENIKRHRAGLDPVGFVDRSRGY